ncbi:MAG: TonB-dependent receptor domain-containing protein [bacterium]
MKSLEKVIFLMLIVFVVSPSFGQSLNTVLGEVYDAETEKPLTGVNISIEGTVLGTSTHSEGKFQITVREEFPITLRVTMVGYTSRSIEVDASNHSRLRIELEPQPVLAQEVVVSASRVEENILRSPVSVGTMNIIDIRETASSNYYDAIADVKGVGMTTRHLGVKNINLRGFSDYFNNRLLQIIDGMDNQFPAANAPVGNAYGLRELDVERIEVIPGASSALYGPNAFNGLVVVNSKSPFIYQGASALVRSGFTSQEVGGTNSFREIAIRYARAFNNKFAFKINFSSISGESWHALDDGDRDANPINAAVRGLASPSYDGFNLYGDEVAATLDLDAITGAPIGTFGVIRVARTGYEERFLMDYDLEVYNGDVSFHYRLNDKLEAVYSYRFGYAPSAPDIAVNRLAVKKASLQNHKFELNGDNFFIRAYSAFQKAGDTYDVTTAAININQSWKSNGQWFGDYIGAYLGALSGGQNPEAAHRSARAAADQGRLLPGTPGFISARDSILALEGIFRGGAGLNDNSGFIHLEGNYNFKDQTNFMELLLGGNVRRFKLNSEGSFYNDIDGPIFTREFGVYAMASKTTAGDRLKLTGSLRYDKHENFEGGLTPRIGAVYSLGSQKRHNFRLSFQTGFRNPTNANQYILGNLGVTTLFGGAKEFVESYSVDFTSPVSTTLTGLDVYNNSYLANSVFAFLQSGDPDDLEILDIEFIQPEKVRAWEIGYKGIVAERLFLDINYYHNRYKDFIGSIDAVTALVGNVRDGSAAIDILNGTTRTYTLVANAKDEVTSQGVEFGFTYAMGKGYRTGGNYTFADLRLGNVDSDLIPSFNSPEHRFSLFLSNRNIVDNLGFRVNYRWSDSFFWEVPGGWSGPVDSFGVLDLQLSYKIPAFNSTLKIGGANVLNREYRTSIGNGKIGAQYYVSLVFDEFLP